jgi:AbrB family looped-hinge helix DNA binding protein
MRITSKGQVTIPIEIRERLGLLPGTVVSFEVDATSVRISKAEGDESRGWAIVEHLRSSARHAISTGMTTDEIMALTRGE